MKILIVSIALFSSLTAFAGLKQTKVIYGDDNRVDVIDSTNSMFIELSKSTAAMLMSESLLSNGDGTTTISAETLEDGGICKTERFSGQVTAAYCSGFLVGDNLLVTAGHCIQDDSDCAKFKWVFDYKINHEGQKDILVKDESIYSCKKVINTVLNNSSMDDFALIELDRKITDRRVLDYRKTGRVSVGDPLVVIGHPSGLPTKIADGAYIKSLSKNYFSANLDTYGGNSGSAVFSVSTGLIEGILVRGADDYKYDRNQKCSVSNVLSDESGEEEVTYITNIPEL